MDPRNALVRILFDRCPVRHASTSSARGGSGRRFQRRAQRAPPANLPTPVIAGWLAGPPSHSSWIGADELDRAFRSADRHHHRASRQRFGHLDRAERAFFRLKAEAGSLPNKSSLAGKPGDSASISSVGLAEALLGLWAVLRGGRTALARQRVAIATAGRGRHTESA